MNLTLIVVVLVVLYALFGSGMMENFWGWGYPQHGYYYGAYRHPYRRGYRGYGGYGRGYRGYGGYGRGYRGYGGYW